MGWHKTVTGHPLPRRGGIVSVFPVNRPELLAKRRKKQVVLLNFIFSTADIDKWSSVWSENGCPP
jgi:hypothetical protein